MLDVKEAYVDNKDIKMGLTFLNTARGFPELVLVTHRDSEAKTLPYLNSVGVVSRKAISALKKSDDDSVNEDEDGEEPSSDPKGALSKKMDSKERRSTGRSLTDVQALLRFDGMEGHAVYSNVVSTYLECHKFATFAHPLQCCIAMTSSLLPELLYVLLTFPTGERCDARSTLMDVYSL